MTEDINDDAVFPCIEGFLTAEELVDLRKSGEEPVRQLVGDKFSTRTNAWVEEEAIKCSVANLKDVLKQKRASRQCDLIQAEWNEEINSALTTKLKGKYVHHMGHTVDGKIALSPEESMFLLENGAIEIMNGGAPMSTEEGFAVILKGKLSVEKYRVYSHLSQLGFIVVPHQKGLAITKYEMLMNLDKRPFKKRKGSPCESSQDNNKKRLTFSGALCDDPKPSTSLGDSDVQELLVEDTLPVESNENEEEPKVCGENNFSDIAVEASSESIVVDTNIQETVADTNIQKTASDTNIELQNKEMNKSTLGPLSVEESNNQNIDPNPNGMKGVITCQNKETEELDPSEAFVSSIEEEVANVDEDCLSERNLCCEVMDEEVDEVEMDQQIEVEDEMKGQSDTHNSVSCSEFQSAYENENVERELEIDSQPAIEVSSRNEIDVMDVDSQDTEISCSCSEISKDGEDGNNSANAVSQDSSCAVVDSHVKVNNVNGYNSSYHVNSCSSPLSCRSEPLLDADSRSSFLSRNELEDDDITLIEVTKKETKPLAVIDLLSGGEESSSEPEPSDSDDDISILKVCSAPSSSRDMRTQAGGVNSRKLNGCKKEEEIDFSIWTPKFQAPALSVQFPDLYQKDVVCVARPPLHLLPNHVNPSKEAYILDLSGKNNLQQPTQGRVWDSYKTMQEYQRSRHMNQSLPEFQGRDNQGRSPRMARPYPDTYQDPTNRQTSLLRNPSPGMYGNHPWETVREPIPSPRFPPTYSMPNPLMNSVVSIRQQNMSMMGNQNQTFPSSAPPFPTNIPLPNIANMGHAQIMSEVQRTAFAVARSMLSYMFNQPNGGQPTMPPFNPFANGHGSGPPNHSIPYNTYGNPALANSGYPDSMANDRRGFIGQQRRHTGRPFPCHFRRAGNKQSWETVKETVGGDESDNSDVEEVPITATEVLWDPAVIHPLVKPGVLYEKSAVLNSLQKTQMAKLNKCSLHNKCFEGTGSIEVAFDVYLPGCNYRKTNPSIPKHRIIVVKATDPIPRFAELAYIQRKWNDSASLQIAFVDNGDVSFMSFNSVTLPSLIPNDSKK